MIIKVSCLSLAVGETKPSLQCNGSSSPSSIRQRYPCRGQFHPYQALEVVGHA